MFSGLTMWFCTESWCKISLTLHFLAACSSRLRPPGLPPAPHPLSAGLLLSLFSSGRCWRDCLGVACDLPRTHNLPANSLVLWLPQSLHHSCTLFPELSAWGLCCRCMSWEGAPHLCSLVGYGFLEWSLSVAKRFPW